MSLGMISGRTVGLDRFYGYFCAACLAEQTQAL
jgi:hypothetical protein